MAVVSENDYPGWRARVDGHPAQILPAYLSMRGVVVPAGRHRIEMDYRPLSVYAGALLSFVGLLGATFLLWRARRRLAPVLNYH